MINLFKIFLTIIIYLVSINVWSENYQIIANENFPVDEISKSELRKIYLFKVKNFHGNQLVVTNLLKDDKTRKFFSVEVLNKKPAWLERYYLKLALSGKGSTLEPYDSEEKLIEKVKSEAGAIGYINSGTKVMGG